MKVVKKVKEALIENIKHWKVVIDICIEDCLEKIKKAETVEEIMQAKQTLLLDMIRFLPLQGNFCYFCIALEKDIIASCKKCPYAKIHGICDRPDSDFSKIIRVKNDLLSSVENLYYSGEKYDEE